jgi:hypothetical protein
MRLPLIGSSEYPNGLLPDIARLSLASSEARETSLEERHAGSNLQASEQSTEEASHLNGDTHDHLGNSWVNAVFLVAASLMGMVTSRMGSCKFQVIGQITAMMHRGRHIWVSLIC